MVEKKLQKAADKLRSKGRGGDTILAHINPYEANILKMLGGAGTKNPQTGLPEFLNISDESGTVVATGGVLPPPMLPPGYVPRSSVGGGFFGGLTVAGVADVAPLWIAVAVPIVGAQIGAALVDAGYLTSASQASAAATASGATAAQAAAAGAAATQTATTIGTALASTGAQISQGVPADKAATNAIVNAGIQINSPAVAAKINDLVGNKNVSDLVTKAGGAVVKTVATGGNQADAINNAKIAIGSGLVGSTVAQQTGSQVLGETAAGTTAGLIAGQPLDKALQTGATQGAISGVAGSIAENQAGKYIENLPIPDHLNAGPDPTSADTIAAFPETNPANIQGPPTEVDTTLSNILYGAPTGTTEGISATLPTTTVTGTEPVDYTLQAVTSGTGVQAQPDTSLSTNLVQADAGLKTYTYDDGSTITVNANGDIVGYTESTDTPYTGEVTPLDTPLTKSQVEGILKLGLGLYGASKVSKAVQNAISSGSSTTQTGFPFTPSDISGWGQPEYTKTWVSPLDINSLFTSDNLLGGTQWAGLQGNQFANIPQVSMADFISGLQNGKV